MVQLLWDRHLPGRATQSSHKLGSTIVRALAKETSKKSVLSQTVADHGYMPYYDSWKACWPQQRHVSLVQQAHDFKRYYNCQVFMALCLLCSTYMYTLRCYLATAPVNSVCLNTDVFSIAGCSIGASHAFHTC